MIVGLPIGTVTLESHWHWRITGSFAAIAEHGMGHAEYEPRLTMNQGLKRQPFRALGGLCLRSVFR